MSGTILPLQSVCSSSVNDASSPHLKSSSNAYAPGGQQRVESKSVVKKEKMATNFHSTYLADRHFCHSARLQILEFGQVRDDDVALVQEELMFE